MNPMSIFSYRIARLFLTALVCSFFLYGCSHPSVNASHSASDELHSSQNESISIGGMPCDPLAPEFTIKDADVMELQQKLPLLPHLNKIILEGNIPEAPELLALKECFPDLEIVCPISLGGKIVSSDSEVLEISGDITELEALTGNLPLFSQLKEVTLVENKLSDTEKLALADCLQGIFLRCEFTLAEKSFATDTEQIDISGTSVSIKEVEQLLPYFPRLKKLDMSFCGISDEDMDAFNQRYPQIHIVWTVTMGTVKVRTDTVSFFPAGDNYYPTNEELKKLRYCTELVAIDIGHGRATECDFLRYTPKVRYLILADTGITDIAPVGYLKDLIYLELFNLRIKDYSPLLNCTKLQDLNIGTTHGDPAPLSKMTWLHNLQWHRADQDPATKDEVLKLPEQLPDTNVELYPRNLARNIGGGWRYLPNYYVFRDIIGATYFNQDQIWDYWGQTDGDRIMNCEGGQSFAANTLAAIVKERLESGEAIVGLKHNDSEKAEILYQTLMDAESWVTKE